MARKGGNSKQRLAPPAPNGHNPPPSTIAAQIVNNASNVKAQQQGDLKVAFPDLLKEYLKYLNESSRDESDPQLNAQVIAVIAEAGLGPLLHDNPFAPGSTHEQGVDSLLAIKLTIKRRPPLLLSSKDEEPEGSLQPPLFIWLVPKLLGLLGHSNLDAIQQDVRDLLGTCLSVLGTQPALWQYTSSAVSLCRSCIDDLMTSLGADEDSAPVIGPFKTTLPSSGSISDFWPESQQHVALPQSLQRTVSSRQQAFLASFHLLLVILDYSEPSDRKVSLPVSGADHLPWVLENCLSLYHGFRQWSSRFARGKLQDEVEALYMQVLEKLCIPRFSSDTKFSRSPKIVLSISSGVSELVKLCSSTPFSQPNQIRLAILLTRLRSSLQSPDDQNADSHAHDAGLKDIITENMEPAIVQMCQDVTKLKSLDKNLQFALCLWTSSSNWPAEINELRTELSSNGFEAFSDEQLKQDSKAIIKHLEGLALGSDERPTKRRKTDPNLDQLGGQDIYSRLLREITGNTENSPTIGLTDLHGSMVDTYLVRTEAQRCDMITAFGMVACAGSGYLDKHNEAEEERATCILCDRPNSNERQDSMSAQIRPEWGRDWKDALACLLAITEIQDFRESSRPRVHMALAIRRVFNHIRDADYLNLEHCSLGQWLLASMNRSLRELRVASVQAIMVFLRDDIPRPVRTKNRMASLEFFQTLSRRDVLSEQETLIMAYGQAARVCGEDELPIILLQLVEYLGHSNALICGMAYNELASLAEASEMNASEMFRPFWRSIGFAVIKDIHNKPQKAQLLSDLTEQSVAGLLLSTQTETLPHLVLTKRRDILQRIATARQKTVQEICLQSRKNFAGIFGLLLCQPVADVEKNAMDVLSAVVPEFAENDRDLSDLVRDEPVLIAFEILKLAADQHESRKAQYHRGFQTLAVLAETRNGHRKTISKKKTLSTFFEIHILGIMTHFTAVLDNAEAHYPLQERKRCVAAIGEMMVLAGNYAGFALPQIRACLQSAMADKHLCDHAFHVWSILINVLDEEDLELVVEQTFALIAQYWSCFSDDTHLKVNSTIGDLIKKHETLLRERIEYIPSLGSITMLSKFEGEFVRLKSKVEKATFFNAFSQRCSDENGVVVRHALRELVPFLESNQKVLHEAAVSQKPTPALAALSRSLLDATIRFAEGEDDIPILCARCLGLIGGIDPYKVEAIREKKAMLVLSNFEVANEVINFTAFLLEEVLVKVFHSTTNARAQGFLAFAMQELLKACGFNQIAVQRPRSSQSSPALSRWNEIPEAVRSTLTPFLNSKYMLKSNTKNDEPQEYPVFGPGVSHATWLRTFAFDLLQKGKGENVNLIFPVLCKVIKGHDLSISTFVLPFAILNVIVTGEEWEVKNVGQELLTILQAEIQEDDQPEAARIKQCSETLDYLTLWLQEKRKSIGEARALAGKTGRGISEMEEIKNIAQLSSVETILSMIPAEVISKRAVECGSYARALFHWEQYYRQERQKAEDRGSLFAQDELLQHLQLIYDQIDEPDSIEGISAHLQILNPEQQIMEHRKAGRWTAAQSWYELSLAEKPNDGETQLNLLTCLKESGQYDSILNYVDGFNASNTFCPASLPFAAEAAWSTGKWDQLERILSSTDPQSQSHVEFNVGVGRTLLALRQKHTDEFRRIIETLRESVAQGLSPSGTASLHACHDSLVKLHALYELEAISGLSTDTNSNRDVVLENLDRRLDILGAYTSDKQYLLGIRRATMQLSSIEFTKLDIASAWLTSARLARKAEFLPTAFNAAMHAARLGDDASKIEYSKLMWKEGHHRKAIQNLQGAITSNAFQARNSLPVEASVTTNATIDQQTPNRIKSHAQLLLAKWLDRAGQTKAGMLKDAYAAGLMSYPRWDKGHYYLGRHYLKLCESEKGMPVSKQSYTYLCGELAKHVIENFIRSTVYGTKYYYQTVPKVLTLWLDMGMEALNSNPRTQVDKEIYDKKTAYLDHINRHVKRYTNERMPAFAWYSAFPQIITRISHPHKNVWDTLAAIITRVASQYPQQALWSLLAVTHSTQDDRRARGMAVLQKLRGVSTNFGEAGLSANKKKETVKRKSSSPLELKNLILHGQKLTDALLAACDAPVEQRVSHVSLSRDLGFNHKLAPCQLVVPIEATMIANLPAGNDSRAIRSHNPFPQDAITISAFMDDVLVLSSLQRPRKVNVRGSDGRSYGLLCKPKDDLRKDQRLMEFNAMINRALTQDIDSSKRRLYIKTYGVTPLNEECGTIEWVEGLKPMRDIIIRLYRQKGTVIDYGELRVLLNEASSDPSKISIFTHRILRTFPPVLHEWFVETFPEPEAWFGARLRYTRSCAVMSIVGHVLGLGDRHGENVLLEEGNGGTFHVDFNCLFDKGLTFEKPELVPFRLTHNMVDAMGPQGVEGPFRTAAELTYKQLRQHEDTLITILETFVHDPTADFLGGKRKKKIVGVPETPQEVLETVRGKVEGMFRGESVPLSVEGYVDALIELARDPRNLSAMYIGWCAFF
ncbi:hypothetical protein BDV96DRAFT_599348 [Lophiotrema nucula]|uniref:non-specific serine/threonine protein kinase n=1 Tax=Lophiotrema nucula TaxID=690887 RepID=A0A6A5Z8L0_9PLEO|nr:hypothetical protein BDV96DRAFT_599348 [Lophiotrema nucula]